MEGQSHLSSPSLTGMGREIGDYPREPEPVEDDDIPVMQYMDDVFPAIDAQDEPEIPGVGTEPTGEPTGEPPGEPIVEPTGVEVDSDPQEIEFEDGLGAMKVQRGKVHKYLGMGLDFSHKRKCIVTMHDYLDGILKAFQLWKSMITDSCQSRGSAMRCQPLTTYSR